MSLFDDITENLLDYFFGADTRVENTEKMFRQYQEYNFELLLTPQLDDEPQNQPQAQPGVTINYAALPADVLYRKAMEEMSNLDFRQAFNYLGWAAHKDHAEAQYMLGQAFLEGSGVKQNFQQAAHWFKTAFGRNSANAAFALAVMYESSTITPAPDYKKAAQYYNAAASLNHVDAIKYRDFIQTFDEDTFYSEDMQTNDIQENIKRAKQSKYRPQGKIFYLSQAAALGDADSQMHYGLALLKGDHVKQNTAKALFWLMESYVCGNKFGFFHAARIAEYGSGIVKNEKVALDLYNAAHKIGNPTAGKVAEKLKKYIAENNIKFPAPDNAGTTQEAYDTAQKLRSSGNEEAAHNLAYWAAMNGHTIAQLLLGVNYICGVGTKQSAADAVFWFMLAAAAGSYAAYYNIGLIFLGEIDVPVDSDAAYFCLKKAAEAEYPPAIDKLNDLGVFGDVFVGADDINKLSPAQLVQNGLGYEDDCNLRMAVQYYAFAAEKGNVHAQYRLALSYIKGNGVRQNFRQAAYWLEKATEGGYYRAVCALANMYENGTVFPVDYGKAAEYYKKAAELGTVNAMKLHDYMQELDKIDGRICFEFAESTQEYIDRASQLVFQPQLANHYTLMAAMLGHDDSQQAYGLARLTGDHVVQSTAEAIFLLMESSVNGNAYGFFLTAKILEYGSGVIQNEKVALELYRAAHNTGHPNAEKFAKFLEKYIEENDISFPPPQGIDTPQSAYEKACSLFEAGNEEDAYQYYYWAAINGHAKAQNDLGVRYVLGQGVRKSVADAVLWFMLAVTNSEFSGYYNIAHMIENGYGLYDDGNVCYCHQKAAKAGYSLSVDWLKERGIEWQ